MLDKHIPGLALAIISKGQVIKRSCYGVSNIEDKLPVTYNTVFEIASMTKQITCAAILLLQEDGQLSVHDFLAKYIPGLPPAWAAITLEQLMNHTSGLRDDWDETTSYFMKNNTDDKMAEAQKQVALFFKPGTGFNYSSGPFFLGLVIEKITGRNYAYFLNDRIFKPLQMSSTHVYDSTALTMNHATGYYWKNESHEPGIDIPAPAEARADVGVSTSIDDMIKWNNALNENRLLQKQSLELMFKPGKLQTGNHIPYGYGWYIYYFRNNIVFEHGGAFRTGFNSRISKFPEADLDIVILTNKWKSGLADLTYEIVPYFNATFNKISEVKKETGETVSITKKIEKLFYEFSFKKFDRQQLYAQLNISGFDPEGLEEMLKGYKGVQFVGMLNPKALNLYGSNIKKVMYYKIISTNPTYWSITLNASGKLVSANLED